MLLASASAVAAQPVPLAAPSGTVPAAGSELARPKGGFMVTTSVILRKTRPAEASAHAIWTLRAALNVGALQCQYSPFLRTVKNYNEMLRHHSGDLARAQSTMVGHFRRHDGARALNSFDQYTTRTYNSFSTLDAQYSFCEAVGSAGRKLLLKQRGTLGDAAVELNPALRAALSQPPPLPAFDLSVLNGYAVPILVMEPEVEERRRRRR
ncbi:hypothetical protein [Polymorphobacter multimanifer]|uniref:hypothetical protein n=1 Tax=Polymorphobacter multimanifer TaxID=1070431 RepID=UPI001665E827|nr:hypothetical protein [Polymorphobacter multimanifer]